MPAASTVPPLFIPIASIPRAPSQTLISCEPIVAAPSDFASSTRSTQSSPTWSKWQCVGATTFTFSAVR